MYNAYASLTNSDSQQSVHLVSSVSPYPRTGDHREARTKRQRLCRESDGDPRNGHRTRSYGRRGDEEGAETLEIHMLEPGERTSGNIPFQQEGPPNSSCGIEIEGASQESRLTQRIDGTSLLPQTAEQTAIHERDAVQRFPPPGVEQESIYNGIAITSLDSQDFSDRDLTSLQPFPNSDPCWTFANLDSG